MEDKLQTYLDGQLVKQLEQWAGRELTTNERTVWLERLNTMFSPSHWIEAMQNNGVKFADC